MKLPVAMEMFLSKLYDMVVTSHMGFVTAEHLECD